MKETHDRNQDKNSWYTSNALWEGVGKPNLALGMGMVLAGVLAVSLLASLLPF